MKSLSIDKSEHIWELFWKDTKYEWFKVETLQDYSGEDKCASLNSWVAGDLSQALSILKNDMTKGAWIKDFKNANFERIRIHIIKKPLTSYLEWEFNHYRYINIPLCGEKVYLVEYRKLEDLAIPNGDFTIFDSKHVIQNHYDSHGKALSVTYFDENDNISNYLKLREILLNRAVAFEGNKLP